MMKTISNILFFTVASALLLSSCTKQAPSGNGEDGLVTFSLGVEGVAVSEQENGTKGTQMGSTSTLTSISVTGWNNDSSHNRFITNYTTLTVSGGTATSTIRWTKPYSKIFYAYANFPTGTAPASTAYTAQTVAYTVPATAAEQNDILMGACASEGTPDGGVRKAALTFKHPLTAVKFVLGTAPNVTGITSITLKGTFASGTVSQDNTGAFTWTGTSTGNVQNITTTDTAVPFIIIPQASSSGLEIEVTVTLSDSTSQTFTGTLPASNWEAGKENTYTINISGINSLSFEYSISDWGNVDGSAITMQDPA